MKKHTELLNIEKVSGIYNQTGSLKRTAKIIGCGISKLQSFCAKHNIRRTCALDHDAFLNLTAQNCYWAGFIAADGCVYENFLKVVIQKRDKNHIDKLYNFIKSKNKAKIKGKYAHLEIRSKNIVCFLKEHFNIIPNKSLMLIGPNITNETFVKNFIRGYVDGDGWLYVDKENVIQIGITSGSKDILNWINKEICDKFKIISRITKRYSKKYDKYYPTIAYYSGSAELILKWLYDGASTNERLDRKHLKYVELMEIRRKIEEKKEKLEKEVIEMKKLYKSGLIYKEIAIKMNIKYSKIAYHLGKAKDIKIFRGKRTNPNHLPMGSSS